MKHEEFDRRRRRRKKGFRLTKAQRLKIETNIDRMQLPDAWSVAMLLQSEEWNQPLPLWTRNQRRRDLGRDFARRYARGEFPQIEPVPGTRAPVLWQLRRK